MNADLPPYLLTPGPLTTAPETRAAMRRDWGSRDGTFIELTCRVRERLLDIAGGQGTHTCIPLQGSGTFAVEAALGSLIPPEGKTLVCVNGAYGHRMVRILELLGRDCAVYETAEDTPPDPLRVDALLVGDGAISHVALVHCETTSGIRNPANEIADVVAERECRLLLDSMSAFGALELDLSRISCAAVMASANKCLEGVPGVGFVIADLELIAESKGWAPSLSLDLHDQWRGFEASGEWRFTPPTQVVAALDAALAAHATEGGAVGRLARYVENCDTLVTGMRGLGFETYLPEALQAPIIVTFRFPGDPAFDFQRFYDGLAARGYLIYPGKLTRTPSFRIGCIGQLDAGIMRDVVAAVADVMADMGVTNGTPAP